MTTTNTDEMKAWKWAVSHQGYTGTYDQWVVMDADERAEYEDGAAGKPTA